MRSPQRLLTRWLPLFFLLLTFVAAGCGDEEEPGGCGSEGASVEGIKGVVMSPNCSAPVSQADVTIQHGSGTALTAMTDGQGEFSFSAAELPGEGRYLVSVEKGPFQGAEIKETTLSGGKSGYVVLTLGQ